MLSISNEHFADDRVIIPPAQRLVPVPPFINPPCMFTWSESIIACGGAHPTAATSDPGVKLCHSLDIDGGTEWTPLEGEMITDHKNGVCFLLGGTIWILGGKNNGGCINFILS